MVFILWYVRFMRGYLSALGRDVHFAWRSRKPNRVKQGLQALIMSVLSPQSALGY